MSNCTRALHTTVLTRAHAHSTPARAAPLADHGIVIPRGKAGGWDGGGIASPGAAVSHDGSVIVGYAAENSPAGGINRGIGVAISSHPLGPFAKQTTPIASPTTICGGKGVFEGQGVSFLPLFLGSYRLPPRAVAAPLPAVHSIARAHGCQ